MSQRSSSRRWLDRHFDDPYVKRARDAGYRSRAAFKLIELQQRDRLISQGARVIDLGAAPGGWSQVACEWVGANGRVVALDVLPMAPLPGVEILTGDFSDEAVCANLQSVFGSRVVDVVLSDISPNMSGIREVDQPRGIYLTEMAVEFAVSVLRPGGHFVTKIFQGEGFEGIVRHLRKDFRQVAIRKPSASRSESREIYLVAKGFTV